ncbi:MAG: hypothetical protein HC854_15135 [Flavobacterium sp.]|nr:hypothetical protein [Flavobacterium sp.]
MKKLILTALAISLFACSKEDSINENAPKSGTVKDIYVSGTTTWKNVVVWKNGNLTELGSSQFDIYPEK